MWSVATSIVGIDHEPAGITQTYEARATPAEPWFRLSVGKLRMVLSSLLSGLGLRPRWAS